MRQVTQHDLSIQAEHVITEPSKLFISPRVSAAPMDTRAAIQFNRQTDGRSKEIRYPPPCERHLPAEGNAGLAGRKLGPGGGAKGPSLPGERVG